MLFVTFTVKYEPLNLVNLNIDAKRNRIKFSTTPSINRLRLLDTTCQSFLLNPLISPHQYIENVPNFKHNDTKVWQSWKIYNVRSFHAWGWCSLITELHLEMGDEQFGKRLLPQCFLIGSKTSPCQRQWTKILFPSDDDSKTTLISKTDSCGKMRKKLWFQHKSILRLFHLNNKGNSWNRFLCILQSKLHKVSFQARTSKLNKLYWSRFYWWNYQIKA